MSGISASPPDLENTDKGAALLDFDSPYQPHNTADSLAEFRRQRDAAPSPEKKEADPAKAVEKEVAKPDLKKEVSKSEPLKKGSDNMTKEDRQVLLDYKAKSETAQARITELEEKLKSGEATAKEAAEYKAKVADLEGRATDLERKLQDKSKEFDGWMSKQDKIALERVRMSEAYEATIQMPTRRVESAIGELVKGTEGVTKDDILAAHYTLDRKARNKAISEIKAQLEDDESRTELTELLHGLSKLDQMAAEVQAKPSEALVSLQEGEKQKESLKKDREAREYKTATERVRESLIAEEFPMLAKDKALMEKINTKADSIAWDKMPADKKSFLAHGAFIAMELRDAYEKLEGTSKAATETFNKKIADLEATISKLTNKPGPGTGTVPIKQADPSVNGDELQGMDTEARARNAPWFKASYGR